MGIMFSKMFTCLNLITMNFAGLSASYRVRFSSCCDSVGFFLLSCERAMPSCPVVLLVNLVADFGDLSPYLVWSRLSLILAGDVETNPGPGYHCAEMEPEIYPFVDKNVSSQFWTNE